MNADTRPGETTAQPFRLSCVVPAHNEAALIADFLTQLTATARAITPDVEIIVVNDGSTDDTGTLVAQLTRQLPVHYIEFSRNFGKEAALQAGLDAATGDCVVLLDADFQHPLAVIPRMVDRLFWYGISCSEIRTCFGGIVIYCLSMRHPQQTQVQILLEDVYMVKILNKKELWTRFRHLWTVI